MKRSFSRSELFLYARVIAIVLDCSNGKETGWSAPKIPRKKSGEGKTGGLIPRFSWKPQPKAASFPHIARARILFTQGDDADAIFYIRKGKVKVTVVSKHGKEAVVAILGVDEFVGEGCLIGQPKRLATASAMTDCVTMRVEKTEIMRVLREEPAFSQMFVSHILARNARVEEDLVDQLFNSTEKRLARLLLLLANFGKEGRPEPLIAKISQETLAEMVGTTPIARQSFHEQVSQSRLHRL